MMREVVGITDLFAKLNIRIVETDFSPVIPRDRMVKKNERT